MLLLLLFLLCEKMWNVLLYESGKNWKVEV